ncbi:hypothetical protein [Desertibacillus haloalkaliphilus]|uniref:hypothetical protein n=1 Tax=Desertibacillus haloalkaliphilus TaxID=1328930 RepID=UPI001C26A835|nr:hypothetical protein [Desertibacillus haloalkaliphilus]MBU8905515.1 hypothetical protein [Desertibacillus haloalkaliphilus]
MRSSLKQNGVSKADQLFHVDFHDFINHEQHQTNMELADEFGLSLREVNVLKKKLSRN